MSEKRQTGYNLARIKEVIQRLDNADKFSRVYWASVVGFASTNKPVRVQRVYDSITYEFDCYVTEAMKNLYDLGNLVVGDMVAVCFVDGDPDKPLVFGKRYIPP